MGMESSNDFGQQVIAAVDERTAWFNGTELPKLQEAYRLHLTCVRNLSEALIKKSLITPDPYKNDKKISDIVAPEDTPFNENERSIILGTRISDYESMLDFICNYMKFSVENINMDKIRKLQNLNKTFTWSNLSPNSSRPNTQGLASCINSCKNGAVQLTLVLISDSITKSNAALKEIDNGLKLLAVFLRERYKGEVRKNILSNPSFDRQKAQQNEQTFSQEIKKMFPTCMPKKAFSHELVDEIIKEEIGSDKEQRRTKLMSLLKVEENKVTKKQDTVDTHSILMDAVRALGSMSEQYDAVLDKIVNNHDVLESEHNTFKDKFFRTLRRLFGMDEPPVDYDVTIQTQDIKRKEKVQYNSFIESLAKRSRYYQAISVKHTPGFNKINAQKDDAILDFLNKQIIENNKLQVILSGLDDYFKNTAKNVNRSKIKGIKVELTTLKNSLVKANQQRAEYIAYVEEQAQMKKLGIDNGK